MVLSDCEKCWDTPCTCGWDLRRRSVKYLEEQKAIIERVIEFKRMNPKAKYSEFGEKETKDDKRFIEFCC